MNNYKNIKKCLNGRIFYQNNYQQLILNKMDTEKEILYFDGVLDKIISAFRHGEYARASLLLDSLNEYVKAHSRLVEMSNIIIETKINV